MEQDFPRATIHAAGMKLCFENVRLERRNRSLTRALWVCAFVGGLGWGGLWVLMVTK